MNDQTIISEGPLPLDVVVFFLNPAWSLQGNQEAEHNNLQINSIYLVCIFRKMRYNHNECSKGSRTVHR